MKQWAELNNDHWNKLKENMSARMGTNAGNRQQKKQQRDQAWANFRPGGMGVQTVAANSEQSPPEQASPPDQTTAIEQEARRLQSAQGIDAAKEYLSKQDPYVIRDLTRKQFRGIN